MTGDAHARPGPAEPEHQGDLDGDPEALEDPVHRGDAKHQHELHHRQEHDRQQADDAARAAAPPHEGD
jgi:hypothetical protein